MVTGQIGVGKDEVRPAAPDPEPAASQRDDGAGTGTAGEGGDGGISAPGVTSEPCPNAVNKDNGCIYLGQISDLTRGPFAPLAVPITDAMKAFWARVNEQGGIDGYDINVTKYIRDNYYDPQRHAQVYEEIKNDVLGLAQTLGSPTTFAILEDLNAESMLAAPASWCSGAPAASPIQRSVIR